MWCASAATCAPSRSLSTASSTVPVVTARAGDDETVVLRRAERLRVELARDRVGEAAHVLALERSPSRDRARVAGGVAVALLELRRHDDDVIDRLAQARSPAPR